MKSAGDKELLKLCLDELFEKMGYRHSQQISQSDLEHLSYLIEEKTRIILSLSTLKRVFYGKFERLPQISTLNALTSFLGYGGWQDFKAKKSTGNNVVSARTSQPGNITRKALLWLRHYRYPVIAICVAILLLMVRTITSNHEDEATFFIKKIVTEGVPNNVIFNYDIDHVAGDSFYIQPTWNRNIKIKIKKNNYTQTDTYYEPGYHTAKLICDGMVLKTVLVHIPTKDWIGYSKVNFYDPYPEYFKREHIIRDSVLGVDIDGLKASDVDMERNKIYYYAYFPDSIQLSSDNFVLKARIRMKKIGTTLCPWIISEIYSEDSFFYFTGTIPGCSSEIQAMFSDKYLDGKTTDLSALGYDVMQWKEIEIRVLKKKVTVWIGGNKALENFYSRPAGFIRGMGFGSNGLCEVDYVQLEDSEGSIVYRNDF